MEENLAKSSKTEIPEESLEGFKDTTLDIVARNKCMYTPKTRGIAQRILKERKEGK